MTTQLTFQSVALNAISHNNQTYITSSDLAQALAYADVRAVTKLYNRHADEFSPEMTSVVKLTTKGFGNGNSEKDTRIFSLRGCHLIAMFAKTPVAKAFRKWVLDLLEKEQQQTPATMPPLVADNLCEEAHALLLKLYHFGQIANEFSKKLQRTSWAKPINAELGGHYIHNLHMPLEQTLDEIKRYIQSSPEHITFVHSMLSLLR